MHSLKILPSPAVPILVLQPRIPRSLRTLRCLAAIAVPAPCAPLSWFLCYGWCEKRSAVFCWGSLKPLLLRCC